MLQKSIRAIRRRLPLPALLEQLLASGRWRHPGPDVLRQVVPFIEDPLMFLTSHDMMLSAGPLMGPDESHNELFSEYRGSMVRDRDLPWVDVEQTLFVIANEWPGDDVGIALDYRPGLGRPRVVASDWQSKNGRGLIYREVAPTFLNFAGFLGLRDS